MFNAILSNKPRCFTLITGSSLKGDRRRKNRRSTRALIALFIPICLMFSSITAIADAAYQPAVDDGKLRQANKEKLDAAWQNFIDGMTKARETLERTEHFAPESTDRVLAEGYRYLLGHLNRSIEFEMRADPMFPEFFQSMSMLRKWTGENPDAIYLKAPINATGYYRVVGRAANTTEWKTSERGIAGPKAPRMVTFQTITEVPGHTGEMAEMANCTDQNIDFINGLTMQIEDDGRFEILIGPERPKNHNGNFILSKKRLSCAATQTERVREAKWLAVREMFSDWENEVPLDLEITRLDNIGNSKPPITVNDVVEKINYIATEVPNQIRFWSQVMKFPLEIHDDSNGDGRRNLPVNGINKPAPPFTAGGVAGARQIYASGVFDLAENEALVIKITSPVEPHYIGFQLNNLWMEGPDQQNYVSSLSGHQLPVSSDGSRYYIIAHKDPGYQGWVATTGLEKGFHAMRFLFRENPEDTLLPRSEATLTTLDKLADVLPKDTPKVSPEQRKEEIAIRQSHIKLRWRGH